MSRAIYDWKRLPGGPRLAVATLPDAECASLSIHIPAGSRDDAAQHAGLAHFVEHMAFKGTLTRSARELSEAIESLGGQLNACTSEDQITYEGRGEAELLPLLAEILSDMVWQSTYPEREVELEREVIGEEIVMYRESPTDHIGDLTSQALWGDHPLGRPITGTEESIRNIERKTLLAFSQRHHLRKDLVIAAAGPFGLEEVEKAFGHHLPDRFHKANKPQAFDRQNAKPNHVIEERHTDQLQLALAWHAPGRHDEQRHALRLLSQLLGEASSSRLFLQLREERGLCYQIHSDTSFYEETGCFEVVAGLDPAGRAEAIDCILAEIAELAKQGPNADELERAKRLSVSQSKFSFESTTSHASWAGEGVMDFGHVPSREEWKERVLGVTADDVQTVAEAFLTTEPCMAEIRPN
ncbi:MAG: pitrilysin family protein [Akkermansiaceae bacterium]|nr:pitrilysin family protein [Akkermansiaceae bacterium]